MKAGKWDARIRRANELRATYPFAAEGLRFYERVAQFQKSLYADVPPEIGTNQSARLPGTSRYELDLFFLLPRFPAFLSHIEQSAPAPLSQCTKELREGDSNLRQETLSRFWQAWPEVAADLQPTHALISWLFLQPYAECLADRDGAIPAEGTPSRCPFCSGRPLVGALRPEGDGAKRSLICALCAREWDYRRIVCPACGEEDVHKLAVYTAKEIAHVRVEACDSCRSYLKTVDLTKDGHAVPIVDDLATTPLDLWASEHGYTRIQTSLLGI
jgi:FdhE protein